MNCWVIFNCVVCGVLCVFFLVYSHLSSTNNTITQSFVNRDGPLAGRFTGHF